MFATVKGYGPVVTNLEKGHKVDSIYLGFEKAFDTVPHHTLI